MRVQYRGGYHEYRGGVQYRGGIMINVGDILSTVGCSVPWGYHEYRGGYLEYRGGCSVPWGMFSTVGDIMMHVGDIMSTVEGVQYCGGKKIFCYLSTPRY